MLCAASRGQSGTAALCPVYTAVAASAARAQASAGARVSLALHAGAAALSHLGVSAADQPKELQLDTATSSSMLLVTRSCRCRCHCLCSWTCHYCSCHRCWQSWCFQHHSCQQAATCSIQQHLVLPDRAPAAVAAAPLLLTSDRSALPVAVGCLTKHRRVAPRCCDCCRQLLSAGSSGWF